MVVPPWVLHLLTDKLIDSSSAQVLTRKDPRKPHNVGGDKTHNADLLQILCNEPWVAFCHLLGFDTLVPICAGGFNLAWSWYGWKPSSGPWPQQRDSLGGILLTSVQVERER